jgi:hypothetical protein
VQNRYHPFLLWRYAANCLILYYNPSAAPIPAGAAPGSGCRFLLQTVKRCGFAFFFRATFPLAALGGSKTVLPAGRLVYVRRPFFAAVRTLYIHEEMISMERSVLVI